nr:hypothetical protein [uncultured Desulfobacter sp.]
MKKRNAFDDINTEPKTALAKAKEIFPETQWLLVAAPSALPSFVNAINSTGIHACLPLPFTDEDLFVQVRLRYNEFEAGRKIKNLQKTIERQNKQLFQIAGNLSKKETQYAAQIQKKEKEIRVLESKLSSLLKGGLAGAEAITDKALDISEDLGLAPKGRFRSFRNSSSRIHHG